MSASIPPAFPNLSSAKALVIDVETRDEGLNKSFGPGWPVRDGYVCGFSVGTDDGVGWYFPIRHEAGGNLDPDSALSWLRDTLKNESQPKLGANLQYDIGWLKTDGVPVRGKKIDVQFVEALLDENRRSYSLGSIAEAYGLSDADKGSAARDMYAMLSAKFGGKPTRKDQAKNIWRAHGNDVTVYAVQDVTLPLDIWKKQRPELEKQELLELSELENALTDILVEMRWRGVRVDVPKAEALSRALGSQITDLSNELGRLVGKPAEVQSPKWLEFAFTQAGIAYPRTAAGNPSFTKQFLDHTEGELPKRIREIRRLFVIKNTFLDGYILGLNVNGRVYGEFHPLRSDEGGAVSGRFSSSNPNLQNIPSRDPELAPLVRGMFLPEEGDLWYAPDYSQIEYRFLVHAARGAGAEEARERYRTNPKTDYHDMAGEVIKETTGQELGRKSVKNVNFGTVFGMGRKKLRRELGLTEAEAVRFFEAYDEGMPFVRRTAELATSTAANRGYIKTVLGRRCRFDFWESSDWKTSRVEGYMSLEEAKARYGRRIRRARTHKGLNAYTQGSGADVIKKAMVDVYKETGEVPLVTVHDELGFSLGADEKSERRARHIQQLMENVVQISVPLLVDMERGPDWGHVEPF